MKVKVLALVIAPGLLVALNGAAFAHNVVSGVYADGMTIEGEIGFSNGDMAAAGLAVEVFNESGERLGETTLQEGGRFVYQADTVQQYLFRANLSSGHVAQMAIDADELSADSAMLETVGTPKNNQQSSLTEPVAITQNNISADTGVGSSDNVSVMSTDSGIGAGIAPGVTVAELQSMIRSAVAQQVRPLQKELRAYKEKVMFRDIAGGLGFIFGLFGVAAWMASKRKDKES